MRMASSTRRTCRGLSSDYSTVTTCPRTCWLTSRAMCVPGATRAGSGWDIPQNPRVAGRVGCPDGWAHGWRQLSPKFLSFLQGPSFQRSQEQVSKPSTPRAPPTHTAVTAGRWPDNGLASEGYIPTSPFPCYCRCPRVTVQSVTGHEGSLMSLFVLRPWEPSGA